MNSRTLTEGEITMNIIELIGLGETQRRLYETLEEQGQVTGGLLDAYRLQQQSHEALIKYQRAFV